MKCNIKKDVTSNALYQSDLDCIEEGLNLLEADINGFLERKNFKEVSEENALQNLGFIASVRKQLEHNRQSLSLNELKVIYIGLNFLRDDLDAPADKRSEKNRDLNDREILSKKQDVRAARQKITAVFTRMGVDYSAWLLIFLSFFCKLGIVHCRKKEYNNFELYFVLE